MSIEIKIRKNEPIDRALRRMKKKLDRENIIKGTRAKRYYEKPCEKRRRKDKVMAFTAMLRRRDHKADVLDSPSRKPRPDPRRARFFFVLVALILLQEYIRWTRDLKSLREWWPEILRALEWIEKWGDFDGDGFIEYAKQSPRDW